MQALTTVSLLAHPPPNTFATPAWPIAPEVTYESLRLASWPGGHHPASGTEISDDQLNTTTS